MTPSSASRGADTTPRIGIDVGGTYTDLAAYDPVRQQVREHKVLTTPSDPVAGVLAGMQELLGMVGWTADGIRDATIVHGTTLATNALVERREARIALLTTLGARDVLETGKENRYDPYDRLLLRSPPLVPRPLRLELTERVLADGSIHRDLDERQVSDVLQGLVAEGIRSVAVCLLHSYANPVHERAVRSIAERMRLPLQITLSSEIAPTIGELDRITTTVASAYILRTVDAYLRNLRDALAALGHRGDLFLMWSDGGFASTDATLEVPIRLLESGPAAGALATSRLARTLALPRVIAFDMGGTTAKICLIRAGEAERTASFETGRVHRNRPGSGLVVRVPSVHLLEIGAGGGSIGRCDDMGLLQVGPQSAGADPGPACYGLGGTQPTVTDANLTLGYLSEDTPLAGALRLDAALADRALASIAPATDRATTATALRIRRIVTENMAQAVKLHVTEQGEDPSAYTLLAFGGAAPLHAYDVARSLGIRKVVLPLQAGVLSATGLLTARPGMELVRAHISRLAALDQTALRRSFEVLRSHALHMLGTAGVVEREIEFRYMLDMRYLGQGHEIQVPIDIDADAASIEDAFARTYGDRYDVKHSGEVEIRACRLRAEGPEPLHPSRGARPRVVRSVTRVRRVWFEEAGGWVDTPVHRSECVQPGRALRGPLVIEAPHTTFAVGPSGSLVLTEDDHFELEIVAGPEHDRPDRGASRPVDLEILMARLRAIADEADRALMRTAFSSAVRDGKDYSLVITDRSGGCLALPTECMPLFVTSMPRTIRLLTERFGADALRPGDVILTNDPWLAAGHKSDLVLVSPVFHRERLVAYVGAILHVADIGGALGDFRAWDIFEEGLAVPPVKLSDGGHDNAAVTAILAANVRVPELVLGDIAAMRAAIGVAGRRLTELLADSPDLDLGAAATEIRERARIAFRRSLDAIPDGSYDAALDCDGLAAEPPAPPIHLALRIESTRDRFVLDFAGSDPQRPRQPLNVPMAYTNADAYYALQYMLGTSIPHVGPQFDPVEVRAPERCILNAMPPMPVFARTRTGLHIATLVNAALASALPDHVQAGCGHNVIISIAGNDEAGRYSHVTLMPKGGMGATGNRDGWNCTAFPTNCAMIATEVAETLSPILISRELRPDSGGPGRARGGTGQTITIRSLSPRPLLFTFRPSFVDHPPIGLLGGHPGLPTRVELNGRPTTSNPIVLRDGDCCRISTAGGGGIGDPLERDAARVAADVAAGIVSAGQARHSYGVVLGSDGGQPDIESTRRLRDRMSLEAIR